MRRASACTVLAALVLLSGCGDNAPALPPKEEKKEALTRFDFSLEGVQYAISLPEQADMRERHRPPGFDFAARKNQRMQKNLIITAKPDPQNGDQNFDRQHFRRDARDRILRDDHDRTVHYRNLGKTGEGSGGSIEEIAGRIEIGGNVLFFECTDQGEWTIRADWCLDYIDTLQITPPASSGNG